MGVEFIIRKTKDLERIYLLDDYISAIWTQKYYEAGDFQIICAINEQRTLYIQRDYFITRDGIDEIGIIDGITYTKDPVNGPIMTINGRFCTALLYRRCIWQSALMNGNLLSEVRELIDSQALNPINGQGETWTDRKLSNLERLVLTNGRVVNRLDGASCTIKEIIGGAFIDNDGVDGGDGLKTVPAVATWPTAGTPISAEHSGGGGTSAITLQNDLYGQPLTSAKDSIYLDNVFGWRRRQSVYYTNNLSAYLVSVFDSITDIEEDHSRSGAGLIFAAPCPVSMPDQMPFTSNLTWVSKEDFGEGVYLFGGSGACGISIFDNKIWIRISKNVVNDTYISTVQYTYGSNIDSLNSDLVKAVIGKPNAVGYLDPNLTIITGNFIAERTTPSFTSYPAINLPSDADIYTFETAARYGAYLSIEQRYLDPNSNFNLALGTYPAGVETSLFLQVSGDNLGKKIEEILKDNELGLRARYDGPGNAIKLDIIQGADRSKNQSANAFVIFSESLDNLKSYEFATSGENAYNVAFVLGKTKINDVDTDVWAESGAGAGITRRETFVNTSDGAIRSNAELSTQLANEGKLLLNGFSVVVSSEIEPLAYDYRTEYNVGDIITIEITDLNAVYDVRILEVREFVDSTGYNIDIVLGE